MNATPVPVVSSRYLFASRPPNVIVRSRPAVRAMLVKENPGESPSCCAAPPPLIRTASASVASVTGRSARDMPGTARMLPPQVRGEATGRLVLGQRLRSSAAAAKREGELVMRLRVVRRESRCLAELADRARRVVVLQPLEPGIHRKDRRLRIGLHTGQALGLRERVRGAT